MQPWIFNKRYVHLTWLALCCCFINNFHKVCKQLKKFEGLKKLYFVLTIWCEFLWRCSGVRGRKWLLQQAAALWAQEPLLAPWAFPWVPTPTPPWWRTLTCGGPPKRVSRSCFKNAVYTMQFVFIFVTQHSKACWAGMLQIFSWWFCCAVILPIFCGFALVVCDPVWPFSYFQSSLFCLLLEVSFVKHFRLSLLYKSRYLNVRAC